MTTGSFTVGHSTDMPYYYTKSWNGANGKYDNPSLGDLASNMKFNPYTLHVEKDQAKAGPTGLYPYRGNIPVSTWASVDDVKLQNGVVQQIKGHDFNLGVALAEGRRTVNLVTSTLSTLGLTIRDLKRGNFSSAARRLGVNKKTSKLSTKDISGRYLELQYGWMPLLTDVYEASRALAAIANHPRLEVYRHRHTHTPKGKIVESTGNHDFITTRTESRQLTYYMIENLSTPRTLGLMDPLSVVWEIIPYSFVVDWFIPIGTYLENLNVIPFLRGKAIYSIRDKMEGTAVSRDGKPGFQAAFWANSNRVYSFFDYNRIVSTNLPTARPSFKSLDSSMSPRHIWNAIALFRQRLR